MKDRVKNYFSFSRNEQRGLSILLGLLICLLAARYGLLHFLPEKEYDMTPFKEEVDRFLSEARAIDSLKAVKPVQRPQQAYLQQDDLTAFLARPFKFNPNLIDEGTWKEIGLRDKVIGNIMKYRMKGGEFRTPEDLSKIYGFEGSTYQKLEPYIVIPAEEKKSRPAKQADRQPAPQPAKEKDKPSPLIELNSADSSALTGLPGIGPSFASRIVRYRELLGGFYSREQLLEVRGMDTARYEGFVKMTTLDTNLIRKMDLNQVTFSEMLRHPYFEYYLVKAVFSYRDRIKNFDSTGQLRNMDVMYDELYGRIRPYLDAGGSSPGDQE